MLGAPADLVDVAMLQWGRDHLIAEMEAFPMFSYLDDMLQWGRDHLIAEIRMREARAPGAPDGFNGAAII